MTVYLGETDPASYITQRRFSVERLAGEDVDGDKVSFIEGVNRYVGLVYDDEPGPAWIMWHPLNDVGASQDVHVYSRWELT